MCVRCVTSVGCLLVVCVHLLVVCVHLLVVCVHLLVVCLLVVCLFAPCFDLIVLLVCPWSLFFPGCLFDSLSFVGLLVLC